MEPLPEKIKRRKRLSLFGVSADVKRDFVENLSLLIESDMGILYALDSLATESKNVRMKAAIVEMQGAITNGASFSKALQAPNIFSPRFISLVKAGEDAGTLSESLKSAALDMGKDAKFHSKLLSALIYPAIVFAVAILVVLVASWTVLPKLTGLFQDSSATLPLATRILIGFGNLMEIWGMYLVPLVIALLGFLYYLLFRGKRTKHIGDLMLFHMPIVGRIIQYTEVARMGYSSGAFLKAGISILATFESLAEGTTLSMYRGLYLHARERIQQGDSVQKALSSYPKADTLLPFQVLQLIGSAEKSGKLAETFAKVGVLYEEKTDGLTKNIGVLIEPMVVIIVGLIVAFVVMAIISPIYALTGAIA